MSKQAGHALWVRICHWLAALSVIALMISGYAMLMTNPNLYWGEVGNPLTPALLELPVSKNYRHGDWSEPTPFFDAANSPVSANRGFEILNLNSWGRSLHFLMAWTLVVAGCIYFVLGLFSGHFRRNLLPGTGQFSPTSLWRDIKQHALFQVSESNSGPQYDLLQKLTYSM